MVVVSLIVLLLAIAYGIFQTSYFQKIVINKIASNISENVDADISIGRVKLSLFSKIVLEDFYLSDQNRDTLLYTHKLVAGIDSLSFKRSNIHFKSISLENPKVCVEKYADSTYNFSFLFGQRDVEPKFHWNANISMLKIRKGEFFYNDSCLTHSLQGFVHISHIELLLDHLKFSTTNDFSFDLKNLKFKCQNGFELKEMYAEAAFSDSLFQINSLNLASLNSAMKIDSIKLDLKRFLETKNFTDLKFDLLIDKILLNYKDIACFFQENDSVSLVAEISGRLQGKPSEIKGKNINASIGDFTHINGDFYINGLPDIENTYVFVNLLESYANLNEMRNLSLPGKLKSLSKKLPRYLDNVGVFTYSGNFTGFMNDFVAYGTAYSNLGSLEGDLSFKPGGNDELKVKGSLVTRNLRIGAIFESENLGKLTLRGNIDGTILGSKYDLTFNGVVDSVDIKNYKYQRIDIHGKLQNKLFNGALSIDDPNLKMDYLGSLDLSPRLPVFEFRSRIDYADLVRLNLVHDSISMLSGTLTANFEGNNIDNMQGTIEIGNARYKNKAGILALENAKIENRVSDTINYTTVISDWLDVQISGQYSLINLPNSLIKLYQHYLPSSYYAFQPNATTANNFQFNVDVKNLSPLTKVFAPKLAIQSPFQIAGYFNEKAFKSQLETSIPGVKYASQEAKDIVVKMSTNSNSMLLNVNLANYFITPKVQVKNIEIISEGKDDQLNLDFSWDNKSRKRTSGKIQTMTTFSKGQGGYPHVSVTVSPSSFFLNDSLWNIEASSIDIDSTSITVNDLFAQNEAQKIGIDGQISDDPQSKIGLNIKDVDFRLLNIFMGESGFNGLLNGNLNLSDVYRQKRINVVLALDNLAYGTARYGDLALKSYWDPRVEKLVSKLSLKDNENNLIKGSGLIDPRKSTVDLMLSLDKTPSKLLEVMVPFLFYDLDGNINGNVHLTGKLDYLKLDGKLTPETRLRVGLKFLKTHYYLSDAVYFKADSLIFPSMKVEDELGNKAVFGGSITHHNFGSMKYNLRIDTDKLLAMNTTLADNEYFYGTAVASGNLEIIGEGSNIALNGDFRTEKGTSISIPLDRKNSVEAYNFIRFVNADTALMQPVQYNLYSNGLNMNFDVDVTPDAKVQLIFKSQIGDIIKGEGNGNLQVKVDKDYNIQLYGDYVIEKGDYLFTLENIINKRFTINRGGTIKWAGDPYDAKLDITAVYKVKTALYDLFPESSQDMDLVRRLPVDCMIQLKESLMHPAIDFKIDLPTAEENIKDMFNEVVVTEEDINKQMLSLLMLGRFYTPEIYAGNTQTLQTGTDIVGYTASAAASTTASELLSNQLTNWLSQISDQVDIGVNYRPGNDISNDQIELALSTQIFNDRVTIDGNIANNSNLTANNSGELIGDFDLRVKITNDGRLQFKFYNHANDYVNYDYSESAYTQGIGFTYREEFSTFKELFNKYWHAIFRKKENKLLPKNEEIE